MIRIQTRAGSGSIPLTSGSGSGRPKDMWIRQCCGSMTFWGGSGSGSADPCLWLLDPDPGSGSCCFRHWPSRCQQKTNFLTQFFLLITVKRGKIGHLLTFKSKLKIVKSIFCGFFLQKCLYELWDIWLQSLNHWFCHQGYHFFKQNHWCPILPKVGLRSDTTLNHQKNQ